MYIKKIFFVFLTISLLFSCANKKNITYISDIEKNNLVKINYSYNNYIESGDVLKIDIQTDIPEASKAYNPLSSKNSVSSIELLQIDGFLVDKNTSINIPVLGQISVLNLSENELEQKITKLLISGGHLNNPYVKIRRINSKFTVLGEVMKPGTYSFYDDRLNIFQALGYAGDLLITAKRSNIILIREENGIRKSYKISLNKSDLLKSPLYNTKNNDIIIVQPNYSKVKSAGFIGSPSSIASISSLLLSITLLIINK
tara:strand:- start:580 stop:1350 length:771 start_codon:yes stop_codon:yes gene_type:complete